MILLAEDDDGHARLVERNLQRAGITNQVIRAHDGQEALDYVQRKGKHSDRSLSSPLLLLLDINMPRIDGVDVLRQVKVDDATAKIPVIMLTTADDPREVERCYQLGCSAYITKPVRYDAFAETTKRLGLFLQVVQIPHEETKKA